MTSLSRSMRVAAADYGKSRFSQVSEILRLAFAPGHITAREYYNFCLFDDSHLTFSDKQKFIGYASQEQIKKILINTRWKILADDKFMFAMLFRSHGFPQAKILATYNYTPNLRDCPVPSLSTTVQLKSFLENGVQYPVFGKPVAESYGSGCIRINGFEIPTRRLILAGGQSIAVDQFSDWVRQFPDGYMFQEIVHHHQAIRDVCGDPVASVRVVVLLGRQGPQILRAVWKVPTGENVSDNFRHGRSGNLLGAIDIEAGTVGRIVKGLGVDQEVLECHPDTGKQMRGLQLPYWADLKQLCMRAAIMFPGFRLQSWDIAICDDGPILLEMQGGDFDLLQVPCQQGMLDDSLRQLLEAQSMSWRREIILSYLAGVPRRIYRQRRPIRRPSKWDLLESEPAEVRAARRPHIAHRDTESGPACRHKM